MRVPVVDKNGTPLMPCSPARARHLLHEERASARRSKLGLFYIQMKSAIDPENQPLVLGIDPGSKWEGYSVTGSTETVLNIMCVARDSVKKKIEQRRNVRKARRHRLWRRPARFKNRLRNSKRIAPSTRARWELKARVTQSLQKILPITIVVVEDVCAETRKGGTKWNGSFSPVQQGKKHLYRLLRKQGLKVILCKGYDTKELRDRYGLKKTSDKAKKTFSSHAVDAWVMAASQTEAQAPTEMRIYYVELAQPYRRQLFEFQTKKGNYREPFGGTRCCGHKRSTLISHPNYGICALGTASMKGGKRVPAYMGWNVKPLSGKWTTSYGTRLEACRILTYSSFRGRFLKERTKK
jgi:hypothetical protein